MIPDPTKHGAFSWCELMTTDPNAAKEFYGPLFGWEFEDIENSCVPYAILKADGAPQGGVMAKPPQLPANVPPYWGVYVTVDDVHAVAAKAVALGGMILRPPTEIPNVGTFAVIQDPQGAVISAITYTCERCE